jgi:hypothetical protein
VEVGQQHGLDPADRQAHQHEVPRAAFAGVHDEEVLPRQDGDAGPGTVTIRQG